MSTRDNPFRIHRVSTKIRARRVSGISLASTFRPSVVALALIARMAWAAVEMAAAIGVSPPQTVLEIASNLAPPNVANTTLSNGNWTLLPNNTRCSDVTASWTFYSVPDVASCEELCDGTPGCALFSYCPPVSVNNVTGCAGPGFPNDQPKPNTCWGMPLSQLPHCTSDPANLGWTSGTRGNGTDFATIWTAYAGASVANSDWFASYPNWPSESIDPLDPAAAASGLAPVAALSSQTYGGNFAGGRGVDLFSTAVRAGGQSTAAPGIGFSPKEALEGLNSFLSQSWGPNLLPYAPGGGIENTGMARGVNEMLLQSFRLPGPPPVSYLLALFPFWPTDEPAAFETLLAKGGFTVSAAYDNATRAVRSPVAVTAAYTVSGAPSSLCSMLIPWPSSGVAVSCGGEDVPVALPNPGVVEFSAPRAVTCFVRSVATRSHDP